LEEALPRLTRQRRAVLDVVRHANDHPTANEIFRRVQDVDPRIAYGTVYNALRALVDLGLVRELKFGDDASRYDGRMEEHHHALCLGCGTLAEVEIALSTRQWSEVARQIGFEVRSHHIQFTGYCPSCSSQEGKEPQ